VSGVLVECGVCNGSGIYTPATPHRLFKLNNTYQHIVGFDFFESVREMSFAYPRNRGAWTSTASTD
jgi:hypothetical protein